MIIDTHLHVDFGDLTYPRMLLERGLVDVICVSSLIGGAFPTRDELGQANDSVLRWMDQYSGQVVGYAYVNPRLEAEGLPELRRCLDAGMKGIKLWISTLADDPRVDPYMAMAQEYGAVVLAHAWVKTVGQLPFESRPEHVANLARRHPGVRFQLAHFGGEWEIGAAASRGVSNLWVDTSGSIVDAGMVEYLARAVGVERMLFGTDNSDFHYCLGKILGSGLNEADQEAILSGNARQLLGI